jgi:hypothetical protein
MRKGNPPINWRKKDDAKLIRYVSKFNAKVTRELRKNPKAWKAMPQYYNVNDIRQDINDGNFTRSDFNHLIKSIDRAFKSNAFEIITNKNNVSTTRWQYNEERYKVQRINNARAKKREMLLEHNPDMELPGHGLMGDMALVSLNPKKFDFENVSSQSAWNMLVNSIETQSVSKYDAKKNAEYKKGYLTAIKELLGKEGKELYDLVESLDANTLGMAYFDDPVLRIQFTSDPLPAAVIAEQSIEHWKAYLNASIENG